MSEPQNSPENFARSICADLGKQFTGQMSYSWCWHVGVMDASGPFSILVATLKKNFHFSHG